MAALSGYLRSKREGSGLTQREVSDKLGYTTPQFISNWERGLSSPPKAALSTLVRLYKINPNELLDLLLKAHEKELRAVLFSKRARSAK